MVDVIISAPSIPAFTAQMKGQSKGDIAFNPVHKVGGEDVLGDAMYLRSFPGPMGPMPLLSSVAHISTKRTKYRTVDATDSTPAQFGPLNFFYIRMTLQDWEAFLASSTPTGILKGQGGAKIVYASGVEDLVREPLDPDFGTWGTIPANGVQVVW